MKARDIKKKLLSDYEDATLEHKQLITTENKRIDEAVFKIRLLEQQLYEIYGIKKKYNTLIT